MKPYLTLLLLSLLCLPLASSGQSWQGITNTGTYLNRDEHGYVEIHDKFYMIGGAFMGKPKVQEYDPATNTWTDKAAVPIDFHHMQITVYDDQAWIMCSWSGDFYSEQDVPNVWSYDPAQDSWTQHMTIPSNRRRGSAGVVVYQDKFYVLGGNSGGHGSGGDVKTWVDVFDPAANNGQGSWDTLAPMPVGRDHFHAAIVGDTIYAIGGRDSGVPGNIFATIVTQVDLYDIARNTWTTLPASKDLPTPRAGSTVFGFEDEVLVMLGVGTSRPDEKTECEAFHVKTQTWRSLPMPQHARSGTQAVVYGREIYVASGRGDVFGGTALNEQEILTMPLSLSPPQVSGPADQQVMENDTVIFSVMASPIDSLSYQWEFLDGGTWNALAGKTAASYEIQGVSLSIDSSWYRCQVSNPYGTTPSRAALLRVHAQTPLSMDERLGKAWDFQLSGNPPADKQLLCSLIVPVNGALLQVIDAAGRSYLSQRLPFAGSQKQQFAFDLSKLPAGVYQLQIQSGPEQLNRSLLLR